MASESPTSPRPSGSDSPDGKNSRRVVRMGKYEVVEHIATGGMGAVYKAVDTETHREVALKVLTRDNASGNKALLVRFEREAQSALKLHHENIVTTYDFGEHNGHHFLAMEFVDGVDLHDYVKRKGPLDPEEARQLILQAARALRHAGEQNIVHRDIKPSNFLLTRKNKRPLIKLTDFGLAREVDSDLARVTRAGTTVGTIDYMSPEQARDSSDADTRSDLYSLGSTWYHLLVGHAPFPDGGLGERLIKIMSAEPPDARDLNPHVSDETWAILSRLLAKDPDDRYQTPAELIDDLLTLEGKATARPKPGKASPKKKRKKSRSSADTRAEADALTRVTKLKTRRLAYTTAVVGVLVLAVVVAAVALKGRRHREIPTETVVQPAAIVADPDTLPPTPEDRGGKPLDKGPAPVAVVVRPTWPVLYKPAEAVNAETLRREIEAPWASPTAAPADPFLARVARLSPATPAAGAAPAFRSLADACAAAPPGRAIVIEIYDNGPLFELPASVAGRDLTLRAAKGYRPLIVWDVLMTARERKKLGKTDALVFLKVEKGNLTLEGIELAVRWPRKGTPAAREVPAEPAKLLDVQDGDLSMQDCTVSAAGNHAPGVTLAHFHASSEKARCRLTRCQVRGGSLTALDLASPGDVLIDGCLLVGGGQPLLRVRSEAKKGPRLRVVRSTLVSAQTLLELKRGAESERSPALVWLGWDSLLSRSGVGESGELFVLGEGADADGVEWRSINCLYAGWKTLLAAGGSKVAGNYTGRPTDDAREWMRHWKRIEGEGMVREPWPDQVLHEPATQPAVTFRPNSLVGYASTLTPEQPLGCDLAALPPARDGWLAGVNPGVVPLDPPADGSAPEIPNPGDTRFHGSRLDVSGKDLGAYLDEVQKQSSLGPRVVMHLTGKGEHITSPIHMKGATLVLYFEPPADKDAAALVLKLGRTDRPVPLIDVEEGGLEVVNGVLRAADSPAVPVSHLIKVKGGDVKLYRTRVEGPQLTIPRGYRAAISLGGSGDSAVEKMRCCALNECVVLSSQAGIALDGVGCRLLVKQSVVVSGTEALHLIPGAACKGQAGMQCALQNATLAGRNGVVRLHDAPFAGVVTEPAVVRAIDCAYLSPFRQARSGLLVSEGDALARGLLVWQGEREGFDPRLYFAAARADSLPARKEGYAYWSRLWGSLGVQKPRAELLVRLLEFESRRWPLERLNLAGLKDPPGANLKALGITGKKTPR